MTLNEQYLKRKRTYFHGSKYEELDKEHIHYDCFFISCDITTSIIYCKKTDDEIKYIHTFCIEKPLNIFNANSNIDYQKLRVALLKDGNIDFANNDMWLLKHNDRSQLNSSITRRELVKYIKELGYDGFFNFEWDEYKAHPNEQFNKPSIGIFDINILKYTGVYPLSSFKTANFDSIKKSDINIIKAYFIDLKKRCHSDEEYNKRVLSYVDKHLNYHSSITRNEMIEISKNIKVPINETMADYFEQNWQESCRRKADEIGLQVPPEYELD